MNVSLVITIIVVMVMVTIIIVVIIIIITDRPLLLGSIHSTSTSLTNLKSLPPSLKCKNVKKIYSIGQKLSVCKCISVQFRSCIDDQNSPHRR